MCEMATNYHSFIFYFLALFTIAIGRDDTSLHSSPLPDPSTRAQDTLNGLFEYFWQVDPKDKDVGFFFVCGEIGGDGLTPQQWTQCSCYDTSSCVGCYRWWDAVILESVAEYGRVLNTTQHSNVPVTFFAHSPYNSKWASCTFIDDFLWYGIAYLKVYEWLKVRMYYNNIIIYN